MDDPVRDIEGVIRSLTQTSPSVQRRAIDKYFTPNASFQHPFCRTGTFDGSRFFIHPIYRFYKILSPRIQLEVNSIAFDSTNLILYVGIFQIFQIWFLPFIYAPVNLTTVLHLNRNSRDGKYYIQAQDDLYQVNDFVKFFMPGGNILVWLWQMQATLQCFLLSMILWPVSWLEEHGVAIFEPNEKPGQSFVEQVSNKMGQSISNGDAEEVFEKLEDRAGELITAPAIQQR